MNRFYPDNDLLAAAHEGLGMLAKVCACFAGGLAIGGLWYLCVAYRAGVF